MSITVNTNISSLLCQKKLAKSTYGANTALQRLSTGYRINSAKDDAAGYTISSQLDAKLSSYNVAQGNAEMGLAMIDSASGAMTVLSASLERMRKLAEEAANGTYGENERKAMQAEVDGLVKEVHRVKNGMEYNGKKILGVDISIEFPAKPAEPAKPEPDNLPAEPDKKDYGYPETPTYEVLPEKPTPTAGSEPAKVDDPGTAPTPVANPGTAPTPVANPGEAPAEVKNPGEAPAEVKNPGTAPAEVKEPGEAPAVVADPGNAPDVVDDPGTKPVEGVGAYIDKNDLANIADLTTNWAAYKGKVLNISNEAGLKALANIVNSGLDTSGTTFALTADITLSNTLDGNGSNWTAIGREGGTAFKGIFEGNDHTIRNLKINTSSTKVFNTTQSSASDSPDTTVDSNIDNNIGLFGYCSGATLKNINIEDANVIGWSKVGILAGRTNNTTIYGCTTSGTVESKINYDYSKCGYTGGLVGYLSLGSHVDYCSSSANVTGAKMVGGLIGSTDSTSDKTKAMTISNSFATGSVTIPSTGARYLGGLVGQAQQNATITNCYCTGDVTYKGYSTTDRSVGGFLGQNSNAKLINCWTSSSLTSIETKAVGNFNGGNSGGTFTNCYFEAGKAIKIDGSGTPKGTILAGSGTSKTNTEMKSESTYATDVWDRKNIWNISNGSYPTLKAKAATTVVYNSANHDACVAAQAQWDKNKTDYDTYVTKKAQWDKDKTAYDTYVTKKAQWDKDKTAYNTYVTEKAQWDKDKTAYNTYVTEKAQWDKDKTAYDTYVTKKAQWDKDKTAYDTYVTKKAQWDKDIIEYNKYVDEKKEWDAKDAAYKQYQKDYADWLAGGGVSDTDYQNKLAQWELDCKAVNDRNAAKKTTYDTDFKTADDNYKAAVEVWKQDCQTIREQFWATDPTYQAALEQWNKDVDAWQKECDDLKAQEADIYVPSTAHANSPISQFNLQVGVSTDASSKITIDTGFSLGNFKIDITTEEGANEALGIIDNLIDTVTEKSLELGATANRLISTMNFQSVQMDSLTAASSIIKDADIAKESTNYIKSQILQQTTATLLATANQNPSIALNLI